MPSEQIVVEEIPVTLTRKSMKNIRLAVKATTGEVRLSAPHHVSISTLKAFLYQHLPWLRTQQDEFLARSDLQAPKYLDGERTGRDKNDSAAQGVSPFPYTTLR